MTTVQRLESKSDDATHGGLWIRFDTGRNKLVQWHSDAPIQPTRDAAKEWTVKLIDALIRDNANVEVRETNWVSVMAAVEAVVCEFNSRLVGSLHRGGGGGGELVH